MLGLDTILLGAYECVLMHRFKKTETKGVVW